MALAKENRPMTTKTTMPDDWTLATCTICRNNCEACRCQLCENCDEKIDGSWMDITDDGKYCCEDCQRDDEWNIQIGQREAAEQFYLYGNDYDSWYR